MEMAEQAALGQLRLLGERADGQSAQAHSSRHLNRLVEHRESGLLTLAHQHRKARPYGKCKPGLVDWLRRSKGGSSRTDADPGRGWV